MPEGLGQVTLSATSPSGSGGTRFAIVSPLNVVTFYNVGATPSLNLGDTIVTEFGVHVRVRLIDGSILNVGSNSALNVQYHDAAAQRTLLQILYGRMRAAVARIVQTTEEFRRSVSAVTGHVGWNVGPTMPSGAADYGNNPTDPGLNPGEIGTLELAAMAWLNEPLAPLEDVSWKWANAYWL